jgi:hypothetical protein
MDAGEVTRDTYGFSQKAPDGDDGSLEEARRALDEVIPHDDLDEG